MNGGRKSPGEPREAAGAVAHCDEIIRRYPWHPVSADAESRADGSTAYAKFFRLEIPRCRIQRTYWVGAKVLGDETIELAAVRSDRYVAMATEKSCGNRFGKKSPLVLQISPFRWCWCGRIYSSAGKHENERSLHRHLPVGRHSVERKTSPNHHVTV
jgi:hypothetical protein